jgi:outer membrane protein OmpA-like peptidoglycan-associated protein
MRARLLAAAAAATLVSACSTTSNVTLLPDEGKTTSGAVAVLDAKSGAEVGQLSTANTQARVGGKKLRAKAYKNGFWADLLGRIPYGPRTYVLYFTEGTATLDAGSQPVLDALRKEVKDTSEVQITGHTDTVGSDDSNDRLSYERAVEIRAELVKQGLPVAAAKVTGRGERELLVQTADGVSEQANRRVEVILR